MSYFSRLILCSSLFALAGCGGNVADSLGLGRNVPDEFAVVDRPPLSMPPDYGLRPPKPGAPRPQETSMPRKAVETLFGQTSEGGDGSLVEKELMSKAGTDKADPEIRSVIDIEAARKTVKDKPLLEELLWWRDDADAATVDAAAEAERLRKAKAEGEPVSSGATPVIENSQGGLIGQ